MWLHGGYYSKHGVNSKIHGVKQRRVGRPTVGKPAYQTDRLGCSYPSGLLVQTVGAGSRRRRVHSRGGQL
jgi:hypothetical protein